VADAVGALGRARAAVVVGDSKQMPPTSFAEPSSVSDDAGDLAETAVEDEESILSECVQARCRGSGCPGTTAARTSR
jgi:superfamily I DNA and/or RNA helicase